jgi:uncharacterized protein
MIQLFKPDKYYPSFYDIDLDKLKKEGITLIACDLDNTIIPHDVVVGDDKVKKRIKEIQDKGFTFVIISNNHINRVKTFSDDLNIPYYYNSRKPLKKNYAKILEDYNVDPKNVVLVGDQILTDIFGANRMNLNSILVKPLATKDPLHTRFNRAIEKRVLKTLRKRNMFKEDEFYD